MVHLSGTVTTDELNAVLNEVIEMVAIGGEDTQIQYNKLGVLWGDSNLTWDYDTSLLTVNGDFLLGATTTVNAILDEDDMTSDSNTALATQQSIKAYVDGHTGAVTWATITGDQTDINLSGFTNDSGFITTIIGLNISDLTNDSGFITGVAWSEITGTQTDINLSGFTNDSGFITTSDIWDRTGTNLITHTASDTPYLDLGIYLNADAYRYGFGNVSYYVDPVGGSDSNDGSIGSPFLTIVYAVAEAIKFQTYASISIRLMPGTHDLATPINITALQTKLSILPSNYVSSATINYTGAGGGATVMKFTNCPYNVTISGITIVGKYTAIASDNSNLFLGDLILNSFTHSGIYAYNKSNIYINGDITATSTSVSSRALEFNDATVTYVNSSNILTMNTAIGYYIKNKSNVVFNCTQLYTADGTNGQYGGYIDDSTVTMDANMTFDGNGVADYGLYISQGSVINMPNYSRTRAFTGFQTNDIYMAANSRLFNPIAGTWTYSGVVDVYASQGASIYSPDQMDTTIVWEVLTASDYIGYDDRYLQSLDWDEITGTQSDINLSGFTNDSGFLASQYWAKTGTVLSPTTATDSIAIAHTTTSAYDPSIGVTYTNTKTTGNEAYAVDIGCYQTNAVSGGDPNLLCGQFTNVIKIGADTDTYQTDVFGQYIQVQYTGATDIGTRNTYGIYCHASGDTAGTSTVTGLHVGASGGDLNNSIYSSSGTVDLRMAGANALKVINTTNPWATGFTYVYGIASQSDTCAMMVSHHEALTTGTVTHYGTKLITNEDAIKTSGDHTHMALYSYSVIDRAHTTAGTITAYGGQLLGKQTGSTDTGTRISYGAYCEATGDTNGTSTTYGVYAKASGADTNWAGYFEGDVNATGVVKFSGGTKSSDGSTGATGSFTTVDGKTVTVKDGIITSIV